MSRPAFSSAASMEDIATLISISVARVKDVVINKPVQMQCTRVRSALTAPPTQTTL